jgi:hypothetical protein
MIKTSHAELEFGPCGEAKATRFTFTIIDDSTIEVHVKQKTYAPWNRPINDEDLLKI